MEFSGPISRGGVDVRKFEGGVVDGVFSGPISRGGVVDKVRQFEGGGVVDGVFRPNFEGGGSR